MTFRYYTTGSILQAVGDFHDFHKSTSKIIRKVSRAIARLRQEKIKMPPGLEEVQKATPGSTSSLHRCFRCTHIEILSPREQEAQKYRDRKDYFSFNCQVICDANLFITDFVCRWPGSAQDATIYNNSNIRARFERQDFGDSLLLGDKGNPVSLLDHPSSESPNTSTALV